MRGSPNAVRQSYTDACECSALVIFLSVKNFPRSVFPVFACAMSRSISWASTPSPVASRRNRRLIRYPVAKSALCSTGASFAERIDLGAPKRDEYRIQYERTLTHDPCQCSSRYCRTGTVRTCSQCGQAGSEGIPLAGLSNGFLANLQSDRPWI